MTTTTQNKIDSVFTFTCPRCDGKGWLPEFRHIKQGDCFLCGGAKVITSNRKFKAAEKLFCSYNKIKISCKVSARGWVAYQKECAEAIPSWQNLVIEEYAPGFYNISYEIERIDVGGKNMDMNLFITDANRQEMRNVWTWFKTNGAKMTVKK